MKDEEGRWMDREVSYPLALVFALDTDLTQGGQTERERYEAMLGDEPPLIRGICVAGRGSWWPQSRYVFDRKTKSVRTSDGAPFVSKWHEVIADGECSEVIPLIGSITDVYKKVSASRGAPPLLSYLEGAIG
jgi:hypothetical protein